MVIAVAMAALAPLSGLTVPRSLGLQEEKQGGCPDCNHLDEAALRLHARLRHILTWRSCERKAREIGKPAFGIASQVNKTESFLLVIVRNNAGLL